ncbi:2-succinylbenzoate--CoA ligase [Nostoc sp. FACHB-152]|uniref:2-succinylbenzoate--CoA ligase n=1 Tax=unclassified Nostoc TaxID=2593658 RepID=UPI0016860793|nr:MULTISPECIES: 2-succinylbenzoate--CoA ligase [unclassified Nostoc]MBD2447130.1 2-succinylbenzoate--CoA ligase [Nostoc sp. FACHB-152]MBD2469192.1 2-succinylbenzoate--CoA ligase [Nostoc sp. FACHB-145]
MEQPLTYLQNLPQHNWLICDNSQQFQALAEKLYLELTEISNKRGTPPKIILAEPEPVKFLASFLAACAANCPVFLCNPNWGTQEWQQVFELVQPDIVWGVEREEAEGRGQGAGGEYLTQHSYQIMIPTGGSSGKIKFVIHTWETLTASVQGFTEYFQLQQVNSFCVLPLYHVSGLMQFMRSFTTGGKLVILPFKTVESGQTLSIQPSEFFISLVPTQLQRLLQNPELTQWLAQFQTVMLGGAPAWNELLEKARFHNIRLAPTYGMTETASQIATLKPDDFLKGKINSGHILPHAKVKICNQQCEVLNANQIGNITIQAKSLTLGYYPNPWKNQDYFQVDDLGFLDSQGYLHIIGRNSDKIITGGENVYPAEIEAAIRETQMVADVCVIGVPDKNWGQALTAIYVPQDANISYLAIQTLLKHKLTKFKIPKHWICLDNLPRNSQEKVNRQALQQIATEYLDISE